jgi:hypothetical protein
MAHWIGPRLVQRQRDLNVPNSFYDLEYPTEKAYSCHTKICTLFIGAVSSLVKLVSIGKWDTRKQSAQVSKHDLLVLIKIASYMAFKSASIPKWRF